MTPSKPERTIPGARNFALWLVPSRHDYDLFAKIIEDLANQHDAPAFEPHVTIYAGVYTQEDNLEELVAESVQTVQPVSLVVQGIGFSEEFFKTLFIEFRDNPILTTLSRRIRGGLEYQKPYDLKPHLSLMYKDIPERHKRVIVDQLGFVKSQVHFDEIVVASPGDFSEGWLDVERWKVCFRRKLVGSA